MKFWPPLAASIQKKYAQFNCCFRTIFNELVCVRTFGNISTLPVFSLLKIVYNCEKGQLYGIFSLFRFFQMERKY